MIFWILGLVLLAAIAYYVMSTQVSLPPPAAPCNKCPHANANPMKTNVEPWQ
jgi:hypothetical protein